MKTKLPKYSHLINFNFWNNIPFTYLLSEMENIIQLSGSLRLKIILKHP